MENENHTQADLLQKLSGWLEEGHGEDLSSLPDMWHEDQQYICKIASRSGLKSTHLGALNP